MTTFAVGDDGMQDWASDILLRAVASTPEEIAETVEELGHDLAENLDRSESLAAFLRARDLWMAAGRRLNAARCERYAAGLYKQLGQPAAAIILLTASKEKVVDIDDGEHRANCDWMLGDIYSGPLELINAASRRYEAAAATFKELGLLGEAAECLEDLANARRARNLMPEAVEAYTAAEELYRRAGRTWSNAVCCKAIGAISLQLLMPQLGIEWFERALEGFRYLPDRYAEVDSRLGLAASYFEAGRLADAETQQRAAIATLVQAGQTGPAAAYGQLGRTLMALGRISEALEAFGNCPSSFLNVSLSDAKALHDRGILLTRFGTPHDAVQVLEAAAKAFRRFDANDDARRCELHLVEALIRLRGPEEAESRLDTLASNIEQDDPLFANERAALLTRIRIAQGRYVEALKLSPVAYGTHPEATTQADAAAIRDFAHALSHLDQHEDALDAYQEARSIYQQHQDGIGAADCERDMADIYASLGDFDQAIETLESARTAYIDAGLPWNEHRHNAAFSHYMEGRTFGHDHAHSLTLDPWQTASAVLPDS